MATARLLAALALLTTGLSSQSLLWTQTGTPTIGVGLGSALLGDRDGDGFDDFITIASVRTIPSGDQLLPVSGRDGTFLPGGAQQLLPGYVFYGNVVRVGDIDGDGVSEYATLAYANSPSPMRVQARNGRNDSLIWAVADQGFGQEICSDLDLNGDGHPDLLVGNSNYQVRIGSGPTVAVGSIWAYDHTGTLLYQRIGSDPAFVIGGPMT